MSPRRDERANRDSDSRAGLGAIEHATDAGAPGPQGRADAEHGSPPLTFSPRRVGSAQDAGAQQQ
jgi:hypothetical protein